MFTSSLHLHDTLSTILKDESHLLTILNRKELRENVIDELLATAIFSDNEALKKEAQDLIYRIAKEEGCPPSSIHSLYKAFGEKKIDGFTVPAVNIRALTYDSARVIFRLMIKHRIGAVVFEIARSEIEYTDQQPKDYTSSILAAAIKEGYSGPVFLQGDHYQFSKTQFLEDKEAEIQRLKDLIKTSIQGHFYNIDIDASTLVDLEQSDLNLQQKHNYEMTALLTEYIRENEQKDTTISIGGEIGHIGGRNSTTDDFTAFIKGYNQLVPVKGLSKVSVQTGTSHGGTPLADGTLQEVSLDFKVLHDISTLAREEYHLGGAVQHGASTLSLSLFDKFVSAKTLEIHLATGLQNIVFDNLPQDLKIEMYTWIKETYKEEWVEGLSEEQFLYKTRKKALGPFKEVLFELSTKEKEPILTALEKQLSIIFEKLYCFHTKERVSQFV